MTSKTFHFLYWTSETTQERTIWKVRASSGQELHLLFFFSELSECVWQAQAESFVAQNQSNPRKLF